MSALPGLLYEELNEMLGGRMELRCAHCAREVPADRMSQKPRCAGCGSNCVVGVLHSAPQAPPQSLEDKATTALRLVRALAQELEERTRGSESRYQLRAAIHGYCMEIERHASRALR